MPVHKEKVTVGWIAPLPLELAPARGILEDQEEFQSRDTTYHVGRVGQHWVAMVVCPNIGTHPAATALATLRYSFPKIEHVLVVGIAGGVPCYGPDEHQIVLGDVVVGYPQGREGGVAHYQSGAWVTGNFSPGGHTLHPSDSLLSAVQNLRSKYMTKGGTKIPQILHDLREFLSEEEQPLYEDPGSEHDYLFPDSYPHKDETKRCEFACNSAQAQRRNDRGPRAIRKKDHPRIHYGNIASANALIMSTEIRNDLYKKFQVIGFEMESAGVAQNCPALVIRGICDYADSHKNKKWQKYAAATAVAYAKELLLTLPAEKGEEDDKAATVVVYAKEVRQNVPAKIDKRGDKEMRADSGTVGQSSLRSRELERAMGYYDRKHFLTAYHAFEQALLNMQASGAPTSRRELFEVYNHMALCRLAFHFPESGFSPDGKRLDMENLEKAEKLSLKSEEYAPDLDDEAWALITQWRIAFRRAEVDGPWGQIDSPTMTELVDTLEKVWSRVTGLRSAGYNVDEQIKSIEKLREDKLGLR